MPTKKCAKCKLDKPYDEYHKNKIKSDGLTNYCKPCTKLFNQLKYEKHKEKYLKQSKLRRQRIKKEVIDGYGGKCSCCNENKIDLLTIDHIFWDGAKERREFKGTYSPTSFYKSLINRNFPQDKYRCLCYNCNCSSGHLGYCPHELQKAYYSETNPGL